MDHIADLDDHVLTWGFSYSSLFDGYAQGNKASRDLLDLDEMAEYS